MSGNVDPSRTDFHALQTLVTVHRHNSIRAAADALGLSVALNHSERGGKIEIRYKTLEQLDDIMQRLKK